jgi:hypothetical protein
MKASIPIPEALYRGIRAMAADDVSVRENVVFDATIFL